MIGIIPSGAIVFVSPMYEGSISDKKLAECSNLLDLLEVGDEITANKGFDVQDPARNVMHVACYMQLPCMFNKTRMQHAW